jgi:hypothetical protein
MQTARAGLVWGMQVQLPGWQQMQQQVYGTLLLMVQLPLLMAVALSR